jgi:hypothetical protein
MWSWGFGVEKKKYSLLVGGRRDCKDRAFKIVRMIMRPKKDH